MVRVYSGTLLVIVGIAALIELRVHEPYLYPLIRQHHVVRLEIGGWDGLWFGFARLGAWAVVLIGALLFMTGLIAGARRRSPAVS